MKESWGRDAAMSVTPLFGPQKQRRVNTLVGATTGINFGVHNSNVSNVTRAILERVFLVKTSNGFDRPPKVASKCTRQLNEFKQLLVTSTPSLTKWSYQKFVDNYLGHKRAMYQNAADSLRLKPIRVQDSYISAFVKAEKINLSAKGDPAPRLIQPRSPRYNVAVGVYIKPIEGVLYDSIAKVYGSPTVMKGLNAEQTGAIIESKWKKFNQPVAVGLDASRFDQHCSLEMLQWEHSIYSRLFRGDKHLRMLLSWQLRNRGFANTPDGRVKYRTRGCRMSGDMNTGLGNCLIMCALVWTYFNGRCNIELANNGDDCVVIMESSDLHHIDQLPLWFTTMGYTMKVEEPVYTLEHIEFCQTKPVYNGSSYTMVRDPRICLTKDLISVKNLSSCNSWKYQCQAISDCGLAAYGNMPIYCKFYRMLDMGYHCKPSDHQSTGFEFLARGLNNHTGNVGDDVRLSFYRAFDIIPDMQTELEDLYSGILPVYEPGPVDYFPYIIPHYTLQQK